MNKFVFVMPLMAFSLLASCGSPSEDTTYYDFAFEGAACSINGQALYTEKIEKNEGRIYTIKTDNEYEELPESIPDIPDWVVYNRRNNKTSATLTINQMQADFAVKITATQYPIEIQFAESVGGPIIDTVQTYKGVKWSQVKKPTFEQDQYKVEGWSFDGTTPTGDIILDNYVFLDDAVVYPSYSYLCSLFADKESPYQIDRYSGKPGEDLVVSISAKPEQEAKFDLPTLEQFTAGEGITISVGEEETKIPLENVTYALSTRTSATLTIPHTLVSGKAVIAITAYQPEYEVLFINESADSHLDFEPVVPNSNEPSYVKKGDSYAFTVMVTGDSGATNPTEYLVPNNYSIYLGESRIPLNRSLYEVKPNSDRSQATVTIKENVIDGKVRISATAAQASCYFCEVISLGGIFPIPIQRVSTQEARHELQLTSAGGQFPYEEDIYVDNGTQALPITKYDNIEYDGENGIITIISAKENDSFTFILAAHGQPLLELANWDDIKTISEINTHHISLPSAILKE